MSYVTVGKENSSKIHLYYDAGSGIDKRTTVY